MKNLIYIILAFLFALNSFSQTPIEHGTFVNGTWTLANSPYIIEDLAIVPINDSLIIEPGVEIKFKTGADFIGFDAIIDVGTLVINGKLLAIDTELEKITFARNGELGNWDCLAFDVDANPASILDYCIVEFVNQLYFSSENGLLQKR